MRGNTWISRYVQDGGTFTIVADHYTSRYAANGSRQANNSRGVTEYKLYRVSEDGAIDGGYVGSAPKASILHEAVGAVGGLVVRVNKKLALDNQ